MASICVFCGSRPGSDPSYLTAASQLGSLLARHGHTTIFGGGSVGLMGALADAVLREGGPITGIIPRHLARVEIMHSQVEDMRVTEDMHERKALMHALADAYITLPGGFGTMEELFEAVTWAQLDLHVSPIAVLNLSGVYDGLECLIDDMKRQQFLSSRCRDLVSILHSFDALSHWIGALAEPAATDEETAAR